MLRRWFGIVAIALVVSKGIGSPVTGGAAAPQQVLPDRVNRLVSKVTVEILILRPTMSYGLSPARE